MTARGFFCLLVLALAGCAGEEPGAGLVGGTPKPRISMTTDPAAAICEGDFEQAHKLATDGLYTDGSNPRLALLGGYALEQMGRTVQARTVYRQLAAANDSTKVMLSCNGTTVFEGKASDVAHLRQRAADRTLASLGVLVDQLEPPAEPRAPEVKPVSAPPPAPAVKPAEDQGKGARRYLAHLDSYKTRKSLDYGWNKLKSVYDAELGSLTPHVESVNLGTAKGEFLRLGIVFTARKDAQALCDGLKRGRQYCSVLKIK